MAKSTWPHRNCLRMAPRGPSRAKLESRQGEVQKPGTRILKNIGQRPQRSSNGLKRFPTAPYLGPFRGGVYTISRDSRGSMYGGPDSQHVGGSCRNEKRLQGTPKGLCVSVVIWGRFGGNWGLSWEYCKHLWAHLGPRVDQDCDKNATERTPRS